MDFNWKKGILLGTSIQQKEFIQSLESDSDLFNDYNAYQKSLRTLLAMNETPDRFLSKSLVDSLRKDSQKKELAFLSRYSDYGKISEYYKIEYDDIQNALSENTAAIEFVCYAKNNTKEYVALIAKKGSDKPIYIKLFNNKQLHNVLSNQFSTYYNSPSCLSSLAKLIWKPILPHLSGIKDIYFAPDGELYNIAIESLPYDKKGNTISDIFITHRVSSTKQICINQNANSVLSSSLYGGLLYSIDISTMEANSRKYEVTQEHVTPYPVISTRKGFDYLPSTLSEVQKISEILSSSGYSNNIFSGANGNEESFKSMSGLSPKVLHIASHGFYIPCSKHNREEDSKTMDTSFMWRAGLIFSGGQNFWGREKPSSQMEDGILTAAEIDLLNLSKTDLLVLSACETALGDIDRDGVKGLQSAFKNAGVKTIIMSLWEVDDAATELMMVEFYKKYVSTGDKDKAFIEARQVVRQKYKEPYYWASFIMLD